MRLSTLILSISTFAINASAYSGSFTSSRNPLRGSSSGHAKAIGKKQFTRKVGASIKMEDFGLFKGTGIGFDDIWGSNEAISEVGLEKRLNKDGLRFRMDRTEKEANEVGRLLNLPGFEVNLPFIGKTYLGPPKVASIWEALGFTATSNNPARQEEKLKAIDKTRNAKKGVLNLPGADMRPKWLEKYGYPRLVGSGGIFYADQLSTDQVPMGGFNMGKSGKVWPIPDVVECGTYGGAKGWGMKKKERTVDGLQPTDNKM